MKTCPTCQTRYTDDTLRFCLQDGSVLEGYAATQEPTVSLGGQEMETVARQARENDLSEVTQFRPPQSEITHVSTLPNEATTAPIPSGGSKMAIAVVVTALGMLTIFAVVGTGLWLYFRDNGDYSAVKNNNVAVVTPTPLSNLNSVTATPAPTSTPATPTPAYGNENARPPALDTPTPPIDTVMASREISQQINNWRSYAESGNLDSQMQTYAPTVDYYRKRGASRDFVRADRARAYRLFNSMSINISNMNVSVGPSGETATAVFDKEWVFEGTRRSTGKVRQQLELRLINGRWLITGERDVKVYYTN